MSTTADTIKAAQATVADMRKDSGHNISADAVGGIVAALIVSTAIDKLVAAIEKATAAPTAADNAAPNNS